MKIALISFVARFAAGLVPGAVSAPRKVQRDFPVTQPEEPRFRFEGKGAGKAAATCGFASSQRAVPDGAKVIAGRANLADLAAKSFGIGAPAVRSGPALVRPLTQRRETKRWPVWAPNDSGVRGAALARQERGFMAGPVLGIGLTVTGGNQPLRRPRLAGWFGARPVPVSGEGDRTVGRRGS
jgi:hypothetical protein